MEASESQNTTFNNSKEMDNFKNYGNVGGPLISIVNEDNNEDKPKDIRLQLE